LGRTQGRLLWSVAAGACAAGALLTLSRGGALALAVGGAGVLLGGRRRGASEHRSLRRRAAAAAVLGVLAAAGIAALLVAPRALLERVADPFAGEKLRSFLGAIDVAREHLLAGVGRGAWRSVSELHRS